MRSVFGLGLSSSCCLNRKGLSLIALVLFIGLAVSSVQADVIYPAPAQYTLVGTCSNNSGPVTPTWETQSISLDVANLIPGATSATLTFDLVNDFHNDAGHPRLTTSNVYFVLVDTTMFVHMDYVAMGTAGGEDTSHYRNVQVLVNFAGGGVLHYHDQYGDWPDHAGAPEVGTAWSGLGGGGNITEASGSGGYDSTTYVLHHAPEPGTISMLALGGLAVLRRRRRRGE